MTKDFRHVGRLPEAQRDTAQEISPAGQANAAARQRQVVLLSIRFAAGLFFLAGLWLITGGRSPIPADIAQMVGIAFIVSAIADIVAIRVMKQMWAKLDAKMMGAKTDYHADQAAAPKSLS